MEKWLILSYFANIDGNPASHHIDDRLKYFENNGIDITLLSAFLNKKHKHIKHIRILSLFPSGLEYEIRKYIKINIKNIFLKKLIVLLLKIIVLPFKIIEKFIFNNDIYYSWHISAAIYGIVWSIKNKPKVIYTTGGHTNAHLAGIIISKLTGVPLVSEFQDPLPFFKNKNFFSRNVEKKLAKQAKLIIYLTQNAALSAKNRLKSDNIDYIYSGSTYTNAEKNIKTKARKIRFAHIGSLSGTRSLSVFFKAVEKIFQMNSCYEDMFEIILVGSKSKNIIKEIMDFKYNYLITDFGSIDRSQAKEIMYNADVLLLIQDASEVSIETIPSKTFEYLMSGKLIFGLTYKNNELNNILNEHGHYGIDMNNIEMVEKAILEILENKKTYHIKQANFSVDRSVKELISKVKERI